MKHKEYIIPIGEEAKEFDEIFIGVIRKQPELIRCKDCFKRSTALCPFQLAKFGWHCDTDYCSRAERKEEWTG